MSRSARSIAGMTNFEIKVVSDTVCPWCYIGKKRLEKGIAAYQAANPSSNDTFSITWHPFYLHPDAQSMEKRVYYRQRFGEQRAKTMESFMGQMGSKEGIAFNFDGRLGSTRDSHRLIQLGKRKSEAMQTRVIEELFASYFENAGDIASKATLLQAGVSAGLDRQETEEWLESGAGAKEVDDEVQTAKSAGVSGVPDFTIQGEHNVNGAQEPAVFQAIFEQIKRGAVSNDKADK